MKDFNSDLETAAKEAAGNWKQFQSFHWHDQPEDADNCCIVYTHNRDSGLLDQSNADQISEVLNEIIKDQENPDAWEESHGHWGPGWVAGWVIRVYDKNGKITPAFKEMHRLAGALGDYPVLDEEDYSRREYEATCENIDDVAGRIARKYDLEVEYSTSELFSWFWENNQSAVENSDDQGGYPSDDDMYEAFVALGYIKDEDV